MAQHYRVIAPDLRGAGWTDAPADGYTSEQLVADVVALLDALELDRVRMMAHDWGALVGFLLCLITRSEWNAMSPWQFRIRS